MLTPFTTSSENSFFCLMNFEEYLESLKAESERGAIPNDTVPLEKFVLVADNIASKIEESKPVESMFLVQLLV